jgi:uncharacterized membrane protein
MENINKEIRKNGGLLFVGFMFVGMAAGMFFDNAGAGTMAGMGLGFIAWAIYGSEEEEKK